MSSSCCSCSVHRVSMVPRDVPILSERMRAKPRVKSRGLVAFVFTIYDSQKEQECQ